MQCIQVKNHQKFFRIGIKSQKMDVLTQNLVPERFSGRENRFWPLILIIFKFPWITMHCIQVKNHRKFFRIGIKSQKKYTSNGISQTLPALQLLVTNINIRKCHYRPFILPLNQYRNAMSVQNMGTLTINPIPYGVPIGK